MSALEEHQWKALRKWLPPKEPFTNSLEVAGYARNLGRHVQHEGARLLALLAERGYLEPEADPTKVLSDILDRLEDEER